MPQAKAAKVHIRWMVRRDMPEVLAIEHGSFEFPWGEEEILRVLRQRNCIGMVAELDDQIVGFLIYGLHKGRIELLNFAVHPGFRRSGIGRQMIEKIIDKLSSQRRNRVRLVVRETSLAAQLFFSNSGFQATEVLRGHYADSGEDGYKMVYRIDGDVGEPCDAI